MKTNHLGINDERNDFFTEVHLLAGKLVLVVAIHSLGGSRRTTNIDENHISHEQFTRVPFGSPLGKGQEPLTITTIGARDSHHPPLDDPRCSKPSRWQHPPRVISESHSKTRTPSASGCNHSSNALGFSPNLTKMMNQ